MDFRRPRSEHAPIFIDGAAVERVSEFKFLGVHINEELKWDTHHTSEEKGTAATVLVSPPEEVRGRTLHPQAVLHQLC